MIQIIKANGELEPFNENKVINSIKRAGVSEHIQTQVLEHVKSKLYPNIPTSEIYQHVTEFLGQSSFPYAKAKYSLKKAIMDLGPTGYPFEDFFARILEHQGYTTSVRNMMQGKCITHEVDIVASKNSHKIMVEAKFHNLPGSKTNVHTALYTKARFNDLLDKNNLNEAWLVTNTKITSDAIAYAICMGMKVVSWNYPEGESLRDLIESSGFTPITIFSSLSNEEKLSLTKNRIILAKEICNDETCLNIIPREKHQAIISEAKSFM